MEIKTIQDWKDARLPLEGVGESEDGEPVISMGEGRFILFKAIGEPKYCLTGGPVGFQLVIQDFEKEMKAEFTFDWQSIFDDIVDNY